MDHFAKWNLRPIRKIAKTQVAEVHLVNDEWDKPCVLKRLSEIGERSEALSAQCLILFEGRGVIQCMRYDSRAMLLEFVDGGTLRETLIHQGDEAATELAIDLFKRIHSEALHPTENFPTLREYCSAFDRKSLTPSNLVSGARLILDRLISNSSNARLLHGDFHHFNIMHSSQRGWLAIDPKGVMAELEFEVACFIYNPIDLPELILNPERPKAIAERFAAMLGLNYEKIVGYAFIYGCLSAAWSTEDGQDPEPALTIARRCKELYQDARRL